MKRTPLPASNVGSRRGSGKSPSIPFFVDEERKRGIQSESDPRKTGEGSIRFTLLLDYRIHAESESFPDLRKMKVKKLFCFDVEERSDDNMANNGDKYDSVTDDNIILTIMLTVMLMILLIIITTAIV